MRAHYVYENLDFERGDVEISLGLGIIGQFQKGMKVLNKLPHRAPIKLVNVSSYTPGVYYVNDAIDKSEIDIEDLGIIFPCQYNELHISEKDIAKVILEDEVFGTLTPMFYEDPTYGIKSIFFNNYFLIPIKKEYRSHLESLIDKGPIQIAENLDFERGLDPKSSLGIGLNKKILDSFNEMYDLDRMGRDKNDNRKTTHYGTGWGIMDGGIRIQDGQVGFSIPTWNTGPTQKVLSSLIKYVGLNKYLKLSPVDYKTIRSGVNGYYLYTIKDPYIDLIEPALYNIKDNYGS